MMDSLIQSLPEAIRKHMEGREYTIDDMGNCGIADKWEDIAMLYRSLCHNIDGTYGKDSLKCVALRRVTQVLQSVPLLLPEIRSTMRPQTKPFLAELL